MLRRFRADLHVHTCLSPCGDLRMSPQKIVDQAQKLHLEIIGICDHNSAENAGAVIRAAAGKQITVLPGLEVCSREEIHILAIFENDESAYEMQSVVYDRLPGKNDAEVFGLQVIANEVDEVVSFQDKLLIGAVELPLELVVSEIHRLGGIAIASHIDRESYSVISQLGFIPATVRFDALELSCHIDTKRANERFAVRADVPFVRNSDAHALEEIGKNTNEYLLECPTFREIVKALNGEEGRMVCES